MKLRTIIATDILIVLAAGAGGFCLANIVSDKVGITSTVILTPMIEVPMWIITAVGLASAVAGVMLLMISLFVLGGNLFTEPRKTKDNEIAGKRETTRARPTAKQALKLTGDRTTTVGIIKGHR